MTRVEINDKGNRKTIEFLYSLRFICGFCILFHQLPIIYQKHIVYRKFMIIFNNQYYKSWIFIISFRRVLSTLDYLLFHVNFNSNLMAFFWDTFSWHTYWLRKNIYIHDFPCSDAFRVFLSFFQGHFCVFLWYFLKLYLCRSCKFLARYISRCFIFLNVALNEVFYYISELFIIYSKRNDLTIHPWKEWDHESRRVKLPV